MKKIIKRVISILLGLILLGIVVSCINGDPDDHNDDANISPEELKVEDEYGGSNNATKDYISLTDNDGSDVPIIVTNISYQDSFYSGFMDIKYTTENPTDVDYKEVNFAVLAWDREGFPLKLNEVDYTSIFSVSNMKAAGSEDYTNQIGQVVDIGYMAFFLSDCTDFDGNTWTNPIMESISEIEGNKLEDTPLSYFSFE